MDKMPLTRSILKVLFLLAAIGVQAVFAAEQTVAVLPSVIEVEGVFKENNLVFFTNKAQEIAVKVLPKSDFVVFPQEVVFKRLGGVDNYVKECKAGSCIVELGRKVAVDYVAQCRFGKFGSNLTVTFELRQVSTLGFIDNFVDTAKTINGLLAIMEKRIPEGFRKIPGAAPVGDETSEAKDDAEAYYKRGVEYYEKEDYDIAISEFTEAIRLNPKYAEAYCGRGGAYNGKEDYDIALSDLNEAIRLKRNYAEAYSERGAVYSLKEDYGKAISDLNEAIRLKPKYEKAYFWRGVTYRHKEDYGKAISDFNEAIRLKPNYAEAYSERGAAYSLKKDYGKAISDLNEAIRLKPKYAEAYRMRGIAYGSKGDYDNAISDLNEAIRLKPKYAEAYNGRGFVYLLKEDYDKAISNLNEAIRLDPKYANAYYNRGDAYYNKGDYDNAISDYTEGIRLKPKYVAYFSRGDAYYNKGDYDKAISNFNEAIRLKPKYAEAYFWKGMAYYRKEDYDKAIADYKSALRIDPNHSDAKKALELTKELLELAKKPPENQTASPPVAGNASYGVFTDNRDGKKYKAVRIGRQTWMAENLNYAAIGSKCYENNSGNCAKYGRLYDWNVAMRACPSGWHLPSGAEWDVLMATVDGAETAGKKLKAKSGWNNYEGKSGNGTDEFGFSALPGGSFFGSGFSWLGTTGGWWSASEGKYGNTNAYCLNIYYYRGSADWHSPYKSNLFSVRCVQN